MSDIPINPLPLPIFALIIGINKYPKFGDLHVAVKDADAFEELLIDFMNVPKENIVNLRDYEATRSNIIAAIRKLSTDPKIPKDEAAIIIYYAGHGARSPKPESDDWKDWETNELQIEMMCPMDIGVMNPDGSVINGIPDRTISALINEISAAKGDNITLVLDCCSSAGINRGQVDDDIRFRAIPDPPRLMPNCDRQTWSQMSRGAGVAKGFSGQHQESHVLLAACGRDESAAETSEHGVFTKALLDVLMQADISELTYSSLMHKLKLSSRHSQTPHCEGYHTHRRLFNKRAAGADSSFVLGRCRRKAGMKTITLQAGAAQGITIGSKFSIHISDLISERNPALGVLQVIEVDPFTSALLPTEGEDRFHIPSLFYAKLTERVLDDDQMLHVYCAEVVWIKSFLSDDLAGTMGITVVDNEDRADIVLQVNGDEVSLERRDKLISPFIGSRFKHSIPKTAVAQIRRILGCIVHFNQHLTRTGADMPQVWMELHSLKTIITAEYDMQLVPRGPNLIEKEPTTLIVDEDARYGLTIHNNSDLPLYTYLFYFDPSELEILPWFLAPFGAGTDGPSRVDAPLPARSKLTIGYGDGGANPWQFLLREGEDIDVGFFKVFLTTKPTDFSVVEQESPFTTESTRALSAEQPLASTDTWGTKIATIVQKRDENVVVPAMHALESKLEADAESY